ncbi:MAG TPA: ABC-three component system protein [Candidatus Kapabacteria bacterium]|nr:ABC-three component system protein [Candidatus Kapabacteria bacterium]
MKIRFRIYRVKIIIKRDEFFAFEELLDTLNDYVFENSPELKDRRKLIHVFFHYMYFNCDIGIGENKK